MLALKGYYDGKTIQPLEEVHAKKNQRLIITILDEFIKEIPKEEKKEGCKRFFVKICES